ncbi:MAG: extracellular solute-binding protein, partial [Chloroflexota bacterium]|nr:extracellular solute-binding protein [Chloroflexota bacterium]
MADNMEWRGAGAVGLTRRRLLARGGALGSGAAGVGALAACAVGTSSNPGTSPVAVPTLRSGVSLTWLTGTDTPAHTEARSQQIAAFQQLRPGITMEHQGVPDFAAKLQAALAAGTPPDLYFTRVADLTSQASRSQVLALDDFAKRDAFDFGDFYPASIEQYRIAGKLHALPFDFPNQAFFCNMQAFEEAGVKAPPTTYKDDSWNFDAFRTAMEGIQRRKGPEGAFAVDTSRELRAWINWVWNNGGDLFSKDGKEVVLNQPPGVEALQFLQDLIYKYRVAPPEQERGTPQRNFVQGKLMLYSSGQPDIGVLRRDVGSNFRWDVVPRPRGKGATRVATGGGSAFAM